MNTLMVIGMESQLSPLGGGVGDSCALILFLAGGISLAIAAYLLYKAPRAQPVRYLRRR